MASLYGALFDAVAAHARLGLDVALDAGLHESYSRPLHVRADCARRLEGLPVLLVGVHCPIDVIWQRRRDSWGQDRGATDARLRAAVQRWQDEVHAAMKYDLEVDTSESTPDECAQRIAARLAEGPPGRAIDSLREV